MLVFITIIIQYTSVVQPKAFFPSSQIGHYLQATKDEGPKKIINYTFVIQEKKSLGRTCQLRQAIKASGL